MSENIFNVGDRVTIMGAYGPSTITTVEKVRKNGNFTIANRPGAQFRQSGMRAGSDIWHHERVVRATPEHVELIKLGIARNEARNLLDKAKARLLGQRDTTTAEEVDALIAALRAFLTPKEPS